MSRGILGDAVCNLDNLSRNSCISENCNGGQPELLRYKATIDKRSLVTDFQFTLYGDLTYAPHVKV